MTTEASGDWPVPSESVRVKWLLTVAEATGIAGVVLLFLVHVLLIITLTTGLDDAVTAGTAFLLFVGVLLLIRGIAIVRIGQRANVEHPPAIQDWWRTRSWGVILAITTLITGGFFATVVLVWGWEPIYWYVNGRIPLVAIMMFGLSLWIYTFYRMQGTLLR